MRKKGIKRYYKDLCIFTACKKLNIYDAEESWMIAFAKLSDKLVLHTWHV